MKLDNMTGKEAVEKIRDIIELNKKHRHGSHPEENTQWAYEMNIFRLCIELCDDLLKAGEGFEDDDEVIDETLDKHLCVKEFEDI